MIKPLVIALFAASLISGCAEHVTDRVGTQLDIVPITYSIGIKIKSGEQDKASTKLTEFTDKHWQIIANQGATISWKTKAGKTLAQQYYTQLAMRGVNVSDLYLTQTDAGHRDNATQDMNQKNVDNAYFDIEVKTTVHKVIADVCQYPKIGHYGELIDGCASESNRWKSMVHPEKML